MRGGRGAPVGALLAAVGGGLVVAAYFLPWISFGSVMERASASLSGATLPGFVSTATFLGGLASGGTAVGPFAGLLWLVPLLGAVAVAVAILALGARRVRRPAGALHLLLGLVGLIGTGVIAWRLAGLVRGGLGAMLGFIGLGLWLTLLGFVLLLAGGARGLAAR